MRTFDTAFLLLSISLGLAACGPDGGSTTDSGGWRGHRVDDTAPTGAAQFTGVWRYEAIDGTMVCSDGTERAFNDVSGTETFTPGEGVDRLAGVDTNGCRSACDVSGKTADCQTDPTCAGSAVQITQDVYTFAGGKLSEHTTGQMSTPDGLTCSVTATATLTLVE